MFNYKHEINKWFKVLFELYQLDFGRWVCSCVGFFLLQPLPRLEYFTIRWHLTVSSEQSSVPQKQSAGTKKNMTMNKRDCGNYIFRDKLIFIRQYSAYSNKWHAFACAWLYIQWFNSSMCLLLNNPIHFEHSSKHMASDLLILVFFFCK